MKAAELLKRLEQVKDRDPGFDIGECLDVLKDDEAQLWVEDGTVAVTTVLEGPRGRTVHIWAGAGDMGPIMILHDRIKSFAKEIGAARLTISGRRGWLRKLPGYREVRVVMECPL